MSKYEPLRARLLGLDQSVWPASFEEVEDVLGFDLPPSARSHRAWWANEEKGRHVQAKAWLKAGWRTADVSMAAETVLFERT